MPLLLKLLHATASVNVHPLLVSVECGRPKVSDFHATDSVNVYSMYLLLSMLSFMTQAALFVLASPPPVVSAALSWPPLQSSLWPMGDRHDQSLCGMTNKTDRGDLFAHKVKLVFFTHLLLRIFEHFQTLRLCWRPCERHQDRPRVLEVTRALLVESVTVTMTPQVRLGQNMTSVTPVTRLKKPLVIKKKFLTVNTKVPIY